MRYMTEVEYLDLRGRGRIKIGRDGAPLLHIQLPEPGGAFQLDPITIVTEPVPTKLTSYGVRIYAVDPREWAQDHLHPGYAR